MLPTRAETSRTIALHAHPSASIYGYAGLLPQVAALLMLASGPSDYSFLALALAFAYAALIFSFLGALWWGLAAAQPEAAPAWPVGVLPSLLALATCVPCAVGAAWPRPHWWSLRLVLPHQSLRTAGSTDWDCVRPAGSACACTCL